MQVATAAASQVKAPSMVEGVSAVLDALSSLGRVAEGYLSHGRARASDKIATPDVTGADAALICEIGETLGELRDLALRSEAFSKILRDARPTPGLAEFALSKSPEKCSAIATEFGILQRAVEEAGAAFSDRSIPG